MNFVVEMKYFTINDSYLTKRNIQHHGESCILDEREGFFIDMRDKLLKLWF